MDGIIHRNGNRYRLWSTHTRRYVTKPLAARAMVAVLLDDAMERARVDIAERLGRADMWGTSRAAIGAERDATTWDDEACAHCAEYHHAFVAREHGRGDSCRTYDGLDGEPQHGPPCKATRRRKAVA